MQTGSETRPWARHALRAADRAGALLAIAGAGALLVSLWLPWFVASRPCALPATPNLPCPPQTIHYSAWESFHTADILLAGFAVVAVTMTLAGPRLAGALAPTVAVPAPFASAISHLSVAAVGWVTIALALYAIHRPSLGPDPSRVPDFGFFVALLAGGAIIGGGWWSIRPETARAGKAAKH